MQAIKETIGNVDFLIETVDVEVINEDVGDDLYGDAVDTSIGAIDAYNQLKKLIKGVVHDIGETMDSVGHEDSQLSKMEMTLSLGFSAKANAWAIFSAGGDATFSIKLTWENEASKS